MITQTFYKTFLRGIIAILTFSIVFGANIALAQNTYVPPAGPPESFNAPAPIHQGQAGQGKWWPQLPNYTIGALYGAFEGVVSKWTSADDGVAATKFCLMDPSDVEGGGSATGTSFYTALDYFPSNIQGGIDQGLLNCIDWESGWGLPDGTAYGQIPWWNSVQNEWQLSNNVRLQGANLLSFVDGTLRLGQGANMEFVNNEKCPEGSDNYVMRVTRKILPEEMNQSLANVWFELGCSNGLSLKNIIGDEIEETIVKSIPILTATDGVSTGGSGGGTMQHTLPGTGHLGAFNIAKPRHLCYASEDFTYEGTIFTGKGMLVDCEGANHGSLTFYGPKYVSDLLQQSITLDNIVGNLSLDSFMTYNWPVPFGVDSVNIKACAGGGGGGGGAVGEPGSLKKPAGGGGGGGGGGDCGTYDVDVEGTESLLIAVGAGGRGGVRGEFNGPSSFQNASDGGKGLNVQVFKNDWNGQNLVSLQGGWGGKGGMRGSQSVGFCTSLGNTTAECVNLGGLGGKGGYTNFLQGDIITQELFQPHNGTTGSEQEDVASPSNIFDKIGYLTSTSSSNIFGGHGGDGWKNPWFTSFPNFAPYSNQTITETGAGGDGGYGNGGEAGQLAGKSGQRGSWGQGGGGGGGTPGNDYANTCSHPDYNDNNDGTNSQHCGPGGSLQGSETENAWYLKGGTGGHGGPGFVIISW